MLGADTLHSLADKVIGNEAARFHHASQWRPGMGRHGTSTNCVSRIRLAS